MVKTALLNLHFQNGKLLQLAYAISFCLYNFGFIYFNFVELSGNFAFETYVYVCGSVSVLAMLLSLVKRNNNNNNEKIILTPQS